ncbi:methyltransferase domain-containing protein [Roseomonas sp. CCTCC AB2023176]|uniref:methyltransferase domain-containing protein n=1 Tax=Roseomonas sp. CCTCC AB2023176 TaxID=3342640 RepID=UPI0035E3BA6D
MTGQLAGVYDNQFAHTNVYGHALALLQRHRVRVDGAAIHLDVGCGYGRIAEPLSEVLGLAYVGVDGDGNGPASLRDRGFEAHQAWFAGEEATYEALRTAVGGRRVASITMLDTLEHLPDGDAVLRAIARLAQEHAAHVVISVPNVAHQDVGYKLAFGLWDYTRAGLLDHTHTRLFSAEVLDRVLRRAGLYGFDRNDVLFAESDQHFPRTHPVLAGGTQLRAQLTAIRGAANPSADVNQFVRICAPGAPALQDWFVEPRDDRQRPFLSVVVRTQGKREHTLTEVLVAMAGQTDTSFEVIVVGHKLGLERQLRVERIIADSPTWLREKCRLLLVDSGERARPLNEGFAAAEGQYIAIMDDDDLPFAHWVETFSSLAERHPGRLLRASCVRQTVQTVEVGGIPGLRAVGPMENLYPGEFDFLAHLRMNQTPNHCLAFPRGVFHDLGMRFDESLTTTEDWDYILRVAAVAGTASSSEITSVYRWWTEDESSRTVHPQQEWRRNYQRVLDKIDSMPILFPAGTTERLRYLLDAYDRHHALQEGMAAGRRDGEVEAAEERARYLGEVAAILTSTSWRIAWPIRSLGRLLGKPAPDYRGFWHKDTAELKEMVNFLRHSTSWRATEPLRRLRRS